MSLNGGSLGTMEGDHSWLEANTTKGRAERQKEARSSVTLFKYRIRLCLCLTLLLDGFVTLANKFPLLFKLG